MVTVSLEEQALSPARVLARVPYLEHLLALVQQGCAPADLPTAIAPALAQPHADLATYLATVLVGLFDPARLELLPDALADYRRLGDPNVVSRALLAQINYVVDVAANTPANIHTTASGVFRPAWRAAGRAAWNALVFQFWAVPLARPRTRRLTLPGWPCTPLPEWRC